MKTFPSKSLQFLSLIPLFAVWIWLCAIFPEQITAFFEGLGWILFWLFATPPMVGPLLARIAGIFSSEPPPPPVEKQKPVTQPVRQPDTLPPFIVGLALGWWLGSGPDDNSSC